MSYLLTIRQKRDLAKRVGFNQYITSDIDLEDGFFEYDLGVAIYNSQHIDNNTPIAFRCFESAASHGSGEAYFKLGKMYENGNGTEKNIPKAYTHYMQAAICGHKGASDYIKKSYKKNTDIQKHFKTLFELYSSKKEQHGDDHQVIGFLCHHGYGTRKSHYTAIKSYEKAAEVGLKNAQRNLGILYQKRLTKKNKLEIGFLFLLTAAYQNDPISQYLVGQAYEFGHGIGQDLKEAFKWFEMSAENRNGDAQFNLAKFYRLGKAVPRSDEKATKWYRKASLQKYTVARVCVQQLRQTRSTSSQGQNTAPQYDTDLFNVKCVTAQLRLDVLNSEKSDDAKIFKELARKALIGDPEAQETIGLQYEKGSDFVAKNTNIAFKWYLRAAISGKLESQYNIAQMYYHGRLTKKSLTKAVKWLIKAAKHGHCKAQCDLGQLYQRGEGVKKDGWKAIGWYERAIDAGSDDGQFYLGRMYEDGDTVPKKISSAKDLYEQAAQKGNDKAQYRLGYLHELDTKYREAFKYYSLAATKNNLDAQAGLGALYKNGLGVSKSYEKAIHFYLKAVDHNSKAKYELGCIYVDQESNHLNHSEAYKLFKSSWEMGYKEAFWIGSDDSYSPATEPKVSDILTMYTAEANNDNEEAQYRLGLLYEQAILVKQDYEMALKYYNKSSRRGNSNALVRMASLHERGKGTPKDYKKSVEYYTQAIESNNIDACFRLAVFYCNGDGSERDYSRAFELLSIAEKEGHDGAKKIFESLEPENYRGSDDDKWALNMFEFKADKGDIDLKYKLGKLYGSKESILYNPEKAKDWFEEAAVGGHVLAQVEAGKCNAKVQDFNNAAMYYKKAKRNGNAEAKYLLGRIYFDGDKGFPLHYLKAYTLFKEAQNDNVEAASILDIGNRNPEMDRHTHERSIEMHKTVVAETNDVEIQYTLGCIFELGICVDRNYTEAAKYYNMAANLGHAEARTGLGRLYKDGFGVQQNFNAALRWFNSAIDLKSHEAMLEKGKMIFNGYGAPKDPQRAVKYIGDAADLGNHKALFILGSSRYREKKHVKAVRYLAKSSKGLNEPAARMLNDYYDYPLLGKIYYQNVVELYIKVAKHKNPEARYRLADIFLLGDIAAQDYIQAFNYYKMAANNEHEDSINIVQFKNIPAKDDRIQKWIAMFTKVAQSAGKYADEAEFILGNIYRDGRYVTKNIETAVDHYHKASNRNHTAAQYTLGYIYHNGVGGIVADIDKAMSFYTKAANKGHDESQGHLVTFYKSKETDGSYSPNCIHWLTELAKKDKRPYQTELGLWYLNGCIDKPDIKKAVLWLDKAVKNDDLSGALQLAITYHSTKGYQNFGEALKLYKRLSEHEDSSNDKHTGHALRHIGLLYEHGHGVGIDHEEAFKYYKNALRQGNIEANYNIGLLYFSGNGVPQDTSTALGYFQTTVREFKNRRGSMCVFVNHSGEAFCGDSHKFAGGSSEKLAETIMEMYPGISY